MDLKTDIAAWDEFVGTVYDEENRRLLEGVIGAFKSGVPFDGKKVVILYGDAASGKSTTLSILRVLFRDRIAAYEGDPPKWGLRDERPWFITRNYPPHPEDEGLKRRAVLIQTSGETIPSEKHQVLISRIYGERANIIRYCTEVYKSHS